MYLYKKIYNSYSQIYFWKIISVITKLQMNKGDYFGDYLKLLLLFLNNNN